MKCTNCGQELLEDSEFCIHCGTKITAKVENETETTGKKPFNWGLVLLGGGAVLLIAVVVVILVNLVAGFNSGTSKMAVYVKGNQLLYTKNVEKEAAPMVVCKIRGEKEYDYAGAYGLQISADGEYLYFYDRVESAGIGNLCRIKISGIGKNQDKNEKKIEEIDSGIAGYTLLGNKGEIVYKKDSGKLIYYNGKEEMDIDRSVESFFVDEDSQTVIFTKTEDGELALYAYSLKEDDSEKIDGNIDYITYMYDANFLLYTKDSEDSEYSTLYVASVDGARERIQDKVNVVGYDPGTKKVYYVESEKREQSLYSYVKDDHMTEDAGISEPIRKDYLTEVTEQEAMEEEDYRYYVIEQPEYRDDFYSWLDYDNDMQMYCYYNYDRYDAEGGASLYYYNELENKWYYYNEIAYSADYDTYYKVADRILLRDELEKEAYEWTTYNLYCSEEGKEGTLIAENINPDTLQIDERNHVIVFGRNTFEGESISLDDINDTYDVRSMLDDAFSNGNLKLDFYCITAGNSASEMELDTGNGMGTVDVSADGKTVMILSDYTDGEYTLTAYEVKNNTLEKEEEVDQNVYSGVWIDDTYYYYRDVDDSSNMGDIYYYKDGKSKSLIKNVYVGKACLMPDGNFMVYGDYTYEEGGKLELYNNKGDKIRVANRATSYSYIEEDCILFMKDEDLYVFDGKEDARVDRNVLTYICENEMGDYVY